MWTLNPTIIIIILSLIFIFKIVLTNHMVINGESGQKLLIVRRNSSLSNIKMTNLIRKFKNPNHKCLPTNCSTLKHCWMVINWTLFVNESLTHFLSVQSFMRFWWWWMFLLVKKYIVILWKLWHLFILK